MNPAMMISWVLGLYLAWSVYGFMAAGCMRRFLCVFLLTLVHVHFQPRGESLPAGRESPRRALLALMNEAPTCL